MSFFNLNFTFLQLLFLFFFPASLKMGSIWFKHRQNQTVPKKSFTSPNLVKYIFTFNNSKDKESSSSSNNARNIPASASDSRIKNIMSNNNNNNSRGVINTKINEDANKESKSSSSSSSEEDKKEENELPKPNFEFPLLNHIYPNRNRRATLAQIDGIFFLNRIP